MVGGWIIQIQQVAPGVSELWCVDRHGNETAVKVQIEFDMPSVGDEVWWQSGRVYFDKDRKSLAKVGYSYSKETTNDQ